MDTLLRSQIRQATWVFLIFAYLTAFVGGVVAIASFPSAGIEYENRGGEIVITGFEPGSHVWTEGARIGDVVEQINDRPAAEVLNAGERIEAVTVRPSDAAPGENLDRIQVYRPSSSLIDEAVGLNILGIAFAVMSVLIYLRARRTTDTVIFALMSMSAAVAFAIGPASVANQPWGRLAMGAAVYYTSVMFLTFFISMTRSSAADGDEEGGPVATSRFKTWLPEISTFIAAALVVPSILTAAGVVDLFPLLRNGLLVVLAASLVGAIGLLVYRLRTADRNNQEQLRIVTLGTVLGLVPFLWLSVIPLIVTGSEIVLGEYSIISFLLIPVSFGYAIARHDLMGIRRLFHRGAAYAIMSAAIIMVYGTILTILNLLAPDSDALGPIQGALLVLMFAGAPALTSVRRTALRLVDRVIYEGAVTQEDLVSAISTVSANETDAEGALNRAISFIGQGFDVEYAVFVAYRGDAAEVQQSYNNPGPEVIEGVIALPRQESRRVKRSVLPGSDQTILVGALREIRGEQRAIVVGPKVSEDIFTDEEVTLLDTVCAVVSTALNRINLLDEVEEQNEQLKNMGTEMQNIQELERQEISSYLHDEPLQKLAYLNSRIREMDISDDLKGMLEDVVRDLRGTSASLSPEMLRSHGLMSALKWMVQDQQKRGPFKVFLEIGGLSDDDRLSEDIELTIYRATQEALNNCRKHANAKSVWVKLNRDQSGLRLSVEDNGVGLKATTADLEERSPDQGLGIRGLKQRVTNLGGSLSIVPRPSRGTAFVVTIPLDQEQLQAAS